MASTGVTSFLLLASIKVVARAHSTGMFANRTGMCGETETTEVGEIGQKLPDVLRKARATEVVPGIDAHGCGRRHGTLKPKEFLG